MATVTLPIRLPSLLPCVGLLSLLAGTPCAALQISLLPDPLRSGEAAAVQLDDRGDCRAPLPASLSPRQRGEALEIEIPLADYCDPRLPGELRSLPIGVLPPSLREVRVYTCFGNVPPGVEPCRLQLHSAVLPGHSSLPQPVAVPLGGLPPALALGLLLAGLHRLRRR